MLIRESPSVVMGRAWAIWHHIAQKIQKAWLLRVFRLFEDSKKKRTEWIFFIVLWLCPHTANLCKHHVKVNFASNDPFKRKWVTGWKYFFFCGNQHYDTNAVSWARKLNFNFNTSISRNTEIQSIIFGATWIHITFESAISFI